MCCGWPRTPTTICWCSTRPSTASCIAAATADWPPPRSGWCCTPPSAAVRGRVVTCRRRGVRGTTSTTGPAGGAPTSTSSRWPADPSTGWPPTTVGPRSKTTRAKRCGSHPRIWTAGSAAPTPISTPNVTWGATTKSSAAEKLDDSVGECVVVVAGGGVAGVGEFDELGGGHLVEEVLHAVDADHIGKLASDQQDRDLQADRGALQLVHPQLRVVLRF